VLLTLLSLQAEVGHAALVLVMGHGTMMSEPEMLTGCFDDFCLAAVGCGLSPVSSLFIAHPYTSFLIPSEIESPNSLLVLLIKPPTT